MAIAEDASSPAAVDSTNATWGTKITTASFTPPTGSLLLALVSMDGSTTGTATSCTVTDSRTLTWTLLKRQNTQVTSDGGTCEVWVADAGTSAAMTVSVQQTTGTASTGHGTLAVKVLTGAAARTSQTGATAGAVLNLGNATSITTTTAGAHVYGTLLDFDSNVSMTANATSALVHSFSDSVGGDTWTALKAAADVGTPGAISIGVTNAAFHGEIALAEIKPAGGGTVNTSTLTAALSFTGSQSKQTARPLTAAATFTGSMARRTARALTAALSFTGTANRRTSRALAGGSSFTGSFSASRLFARALTAVLSFTGGQSKQTARSQTATLTTGGSLSRRVSRAFNAVLSFTGSLASLKSGSGGTAYTQALSAGLSFTGTVSKRTSRALTAALTPAGAIGRLIGRAFTAAVGLAGTLVGRNSAPITVQVGLPFTDWAVAAPFTDWSTNVPFTDWQTTGPVDTGDWTALTPFTDWATQAPFTD